VDDKKGRIVWNLVPYMYLFDCVWRSFASAGRGAVQAVHFIPRDGLLVWDAMVFGWNVSLYWPAND